MITSSFGRTFKLGVKSLLLHKLRSLLTTLGIFCGVASVIAMLAIGEGGSYAEQQRIKALGSNNIILKSLKPPETQSEQNSGSSRSALAYGLTYDDAEAIQETLPAVRVVVPVRKFPKKVRYGEHVMTSTIYGTHPRFMAVTNLQAVNEGRFLVRRDVERKRNVAVLGSSVARTLFPLENPLGKSVRIGKEAFRIVGVLARPDSGGSESPATETANGVFIPLSAARSFFGELTVKISSGSREFERVQLHTIQVQVARNEDVVPTARAVASLLAKRHPKDDYEIEVPLEMLRMAKEANRTWSWVLASIGGISLLVGGIGVMNVMLATVTERTREIGIRRALGAKRHHIISQFLVESVVLCCLGGLLGILGGITLPAIIEYYSNMKTIISPIFPVIAFLISAGVGVVFGLYPAWRAAQMDPVEALRHE